VRIPGLSGVTAISGQYHDGYALKGDGTVWAWGAQLAGALGNGTTGDAEQPTPVRVATLSGVTAIGAATDNGYARRSDGTLWAWGAGAQGAVGNGTTADSSTPVRVSGLSGVTSIAHSTGATAYATLADGTVWAWGLGDYGALGDGLGTYQYVVSTPVRVGA
jgi:alpha-tubulin suppressor-like RCC1 family protein